MNTEQSGLDRRIPRASPVGVSKYESYLRNQYTFIGLPITVRTFLNPEIPLLFPVPCSLFPVPCSSSTILLMIELDFFD